MRKAIVIGCHVNGLGIIRSLESKQFEILALSHNKKIDFAQTSRFVAETARIPHPGFEEREFVQFLKDLPSRWKGSLIIETNDDVSIALARHKQTLADHFKIITPDWRVLQSLIEKDKTYQLAELCSVPYPRTLFPKMKDDLIAYQSKIPYPCILKPVFGHQFFRQFHKKNFKINNFDELLTQFEFCLAAGHPMIVQEIIPGPDSNIHQIFMYISTAGNALASFWIRKLRQNPPQFGVARVAISEEMIPCIKDFTLRILKEIQFTGIMHSEFKLDPRDGEYKLIEINGRSARANWLATYCGMNLPWFAYADLYDGIEIENGSYESNVYWIELSKDIEHSLRRRREEGLQMKDYLQPYLSRKKTFADVSIHDVVPLFRRMANVFYYR